MLRLLLTLLFFLSFLLSTVDGLKILVVSPVFGRSHMQFMGNLADLYVRNGHEVVYFEPEIVDDDPVLQFQSSKLARSIKKKKSWKGEHAFANFQSKGWSMEHDNVWEGMAALTGFINAMGESCRDILQDKELLNHLRDEKFDLGVAEYLTACPYALYRKIGIQKYITASATPVGAGFGKMFGVATLPSLAHIPEFFSVPFEQTTFMFRLLNMINYFGADLLFGDFFMGPVMKAMTEHYPDLKLDQLIAESSYIFINANDHIEFTKPMPLKYINIAGIGVPKAKGLPEDYQRFMDGATNGVVLVSFGSISQSHMMPPKIKQAFLEAFDEFPQIKFLWKYENATENVAEGHSNVLTKAWVPQVDLFNHKNLIGFITHGGMNSLIESSVYGVPTICIALFGDQTRNCKMSEHRGLAIRLEKPDVSKETLTESLRELIYNDKYLKQARNIEQMIKKAPMTPEERVLKYTEFAAQFDIAQNLDDQGRTLSTVAFYNLDVFALLTFVALFLLFVSYFVVRLLLRLVVRILRCVIGLVGASKSKTE